MKEFCKEMIVAQLRAVAASLWSSYGKHKSVIFFFSVDSFRLRLYNKFSVYSLTQTFFRFLVNDRFRPQY